MGLDNVDLEAFQAIVTSQEKGAIYKMMVGGKERFLNPVTQEPYWPCGLAGKDMIGRVLPASYYNAKIGKPILFVGPSGTGKTALSECLIRNFHSGNIYDENGERKTDDQIEYMKGKSPRRQQNYANILPEAVVGEWNAWKLLRADPKIDPDDLWDKPYFRKGTLTEALDSGTGILLDEITRAGEETQNVYLEPLREGKITVEGLCFGKCQKESEDESLEKKAETKEEKAKKELMKGFQVYATANEGDIGTQDLSTALQTRLSRIPIDFIGKDDETRLIEQQVFSGGKDKTQQALASKVSCLVNHYRGKTSKGVLDVKPSTRDSFDLAKIFYEMGATDVTLREPEFAKRVGEVIRSVIGKNKKDADLVKQDLQHESICNLPTIKLEGE